MQILTKAAKSLAEITNRPLPECMVLAAAIIESLRNPPQEIYGVLYRGVNKFGKADWNGACNAILKAGQ